MAVYRIEVHICATAYIHADTAEEAQAIADDIGPAYLEVAECDGDLPISGARYSDAPPVSLSPAMTVVGIEEADNRVELVEE